MVKTFFTVVKNKDFTYLSSFSNTTSQEWKQFLKLCNDLAATRNVDVFFTVTEFVPYFPYLAIAD